jgi:hypothetical protein
MPRINLNSNFAFSLCLGRYEPAQFVRRPGTKQPVESFSIPYLTSNVQFFQCEHVKRLVNNGFAYAMISVQHKPSLTSTQPPQFAMSGTCAYMLKPATQIAVTPLHGSQMFRIKERVVRANGDVKYASVYA